jgi:hypothetical protein
MFHIALVSLVDMGTLSFLGICMRIVNLFLIGETNIYRGIKLTAKTYKTSN